MDGLDFNAERHEYRLHGRVIPNVTRILDPLTDIHKMPADRVEFARLRGQAVHQATALWDWEMLDEASVDPQIVGYLDAWKRFRAESGFVPELIEHRVVHLLHGYAGTLDRTGRMRATAPGMLDIIDIKTSSDVYLKAVGPQTAAYAKAVENQCRIVPWRRLAVQLRPDGTYRVHTCTDANDFAVFMAALTLYQWQLKHN
jgi:hypothetical protein